jgi:TPR repeat/Tetratricopeptide repeat
MRRKCLYGLFLSGFFVVANNSMAEVPRDCLQAEQAAQSRRFQVSILYYDNCLNSTRISMEQKARYFQYRGTAYRYMGRYDNAFADLNTAIRLDPDNAELYVSRGLVWRVQGNMEKAVSDFSLSLEMEPGNALAHLNRGAVYEMSGQIAKAKQDFQAALDAGARHQFALEKAGHYGLAVPREAISPVPEITWNLPVAFEQKQQNKSSGKLVSHYVRTTETLDNWSEMLSVRIDMSADRPAAKIDTVLSTMLEAYQEVCSHSDIRYVEFDEGSTPPQLDVTMRAAMVFCTDRLKPLPAKEGPFKRNTFVFYKVVAMPRGIVTFHYQWQDDEKPARLIESSGHLTHFVLPLMNDADVRMIRDEKDTHFVALN